MSHPYSIPDLGSHLQWYAQCLQWGVRSQKLAWSWWCDPPLPVSSGNLDPLGLQDAIVNLFSSWLHDPKPLWEAQHHYWRDSLALLSHTTSRLNGHDPAPVIEPHPSDKRFRDEAWQQPAFAHVQQAYLLFARFVQHTMDIENPHGQQTDKLDFFVKQWIDALSPGNYPATNPLVWGNAVETDGASLLQGFENLLTDLERGDGQVTMTDPAAFTLGVDLACTPGKVIFQNRMLQLIQYSASTTDVYRRPLLLIPPWINKYYILDLRSENSFVRWLVEQGHTVFLISWVNPDSSYADTSFDDYVDEGVFAALDAIEQITGEREINTVGYCIGGTLLGAALAVLHARGDPRIASATFFTTLLDFAEPGEIKVFIDEQQIQVLEKRMALHGYLDGRLMSTAFNLLRSNDLIWSFVINNYLMGRQPLPFDLLYWNADSTRLPATMHSYYLRNMYLHNRLCEPGALALTGAEVDITAINTPSYFLSTKEDHIAPWGSTYNGARLFSGPVRFVLGASGHIAGVINPPVKNKYGYWSNDGSALPGEPAQWFAQSTYRDGSWWPDWQQWVTGLCADRVEARQLGAAEYPVLEDAPGSYVRVRI